MPKPNPGVTVMNQKTHKSTQFDSSAAATLRSQGGHTLVEVMVALSVLGFMVVSLYAGFSSGFAVLRVARENLRATQSLQERMEVLRLIKWATVPPGLPPMPFTPPSHPPQ